MSYDCTYPTTDQLKRRLYDLAQKEEKTPSEYAEMDLIYDELDCAEAEMTLYRARRDMEPW